MSSYPFVVLARKLGASYADVSAWADQCRTKEMTYWAHEASRKLNPLQQAKIATAVRDEMIRRGEKPPESTTLITHG